MTARKGNQYLLYMDDAPYSEGIVQVAVNSATLEGFETRFLEANVEAGAKIFITPAKTIDQTGSVAVTSGSATVSGTNTGPAWKPDQGDATVKVGQTFVIGEPETVTVTSNWNNKKAYPGQTIVDVTEDDKSVVGSEVRVTNLSLPVYDSSSSNLQKIDSGDRFISSAKGDFSKIDGKDLFVVVNNEFVSKVSSISAPVEHRTGALKQIKVGDTKIKGKNTKWASENNIGKNDVISFKDVSRRYVIKEVIDDETIELYSPVQDNISASTKYVIKSKTKIFVENYLSDFPENTKYEIIDDSRKSDISTFKTSIRRKISNTKIELKDPLPGYTTNETNLEVVAFQGKTFISKVKTIVDGTNITLEDKSPITVNSTSASVDFAFIVDPNGTEFESTISTVDGNEKITLGAAVTTGASFATYYTPRVTKTLVAGLQGDTTSRSVTPADATSKDSFSSNYRYRELSANSGTPAWSHASNGILRSTLEDVDCATKGNEVLVYVVDSDTTSAGKGTRLIPGARANTISMQDPIVEITAKDSYVKSGTNINRRYRELCPQSGTPMLTVTGSGVLNDDASVNDEVVSLADFSAELGALETFIMKIVVPGFATFQGEFILTSYEEGGDNDDIGTYSYTAESAGDWTLTDYDRGNRILTNFRAKDFRNFEIREYSSDKTPVLQVTYAGQFQIAQYDLTGDDGAIGTFSIQLESSEYIETTLG